MPETIISTLLMLIYLIFTIALGRRYHYYSHFIAEKIEA